MPRSAVPNGKVNKTMPRVALIPAEFRFSDLSTRTFSLGITALGTVWLSGCTAGRLDVASGRTVVEGDLVAQARIALEKSRMVLDAGGLGFGDIVTMTQYLTPAALADLPKLLALYGEVFSGALPILNTIVVKSLLRGKALIEIESVAGHGTGGDLEYLPAVSGANVTEMHARSTEMLRARGLGDGDVVRMTEMLTAQAFADASGAADVVQCGLHVVMPRVLDADAGAQRLMTASRSAQKRVLFLAAEGDPAAGGVEEQCREIYARIGKMLKTESLGLDSVVKTTEFVTPEGLAAYRKTADVRRDVFVAPYPAATGVVCERLVHPEALIAVEVIAVRDVA